MSEGAWTLPVALGIGILLGIERERRKGRGLGRGAAGVRTFALIALLGALAARAGMEVLAVAVAFVAAAALVAYLRDTGEDPGLTTESALVVCVLLGALSVEEPALAAGLAVAVTLVLVSRSRLHRLARDTLTEQELHDGLLFAATALIVLPLVPDRGFGPGDALNPQTVWRLVVIVMAINAAGYVALRTLGARRGLALAGFVGGFVSSAATVGAMGARAVREPRLWRPAVAAAVLSTVATVLLTAIVIAAISDDALGPLTPSLTLAGVAAVAYAGVTLRRSDPARGGPPLELGRAFDLKAPLVLALTVSLVLVAAELLQDELGDAGVVLAAGIAGFADAQSAAASVAALVADGRLDGHAAALPILVGLTNTVPKAILALTLGGGRYAGRVGVGLVLVLGAAWIGFALI